MQSYRIRLSDLEEAQERASRDYHTAYLHDCSDRFRLEVERAFANLKDVIELRPIYHRTDDRVEAHIFVAALAFLLHRTIEKKLKAADLDLSATEALTALKSVRVVDISLGKTASKRAVTARHTACRCRAASSRHHRSQPTDPAGTG